MAGGTSGAFVGSPTWATGLYGPQLGNFSASNYVTFDNTPQVLGVAFPCWLVVMFVNTGVGDYVLASQVNLASANPLVELRINQGGARALRDTI